MELRAQLLDPMRMMSKAREAGIGREAEAVHVCVYTYAFNTLR